MQFSNNNLYPRLPGDANQSVHIVADEGLEAYLPLADMVDVSEEVKRLSKRLSKMQSEYDALVARLNSQSVRLLISACFTDIIQNTPCMLMYFFHTVVCRKGS